MSASMAPIPTPPWLRVRRAIERYGAAIALLVSVLVAIALWERYEPMSGVVGVVHAERWEITALEDGLLVPLADGSLERFGSVQAGSVVARLDDRPLQAELSVLRAEIAVTRAEVQATTASLRMERADRLRDQALTMQRLRVDMQDLRLDVLDRRSTVEALSIELQRAEEQLEQSRRLQERGAETAFAMRLLELEAQRLRTQVQEEQEALTQASRALQRAEREMRELPDAADEALDAMLAPLQARIQVHEAMLDALVLRLESLQLVAPAAGQVTEILRKPGEIVRAGEPLLYIAEPDASHIVAWVPNRSTRIPEVGQGVRVRRLQEPAAEYRSQVMALGVQVEVIAEEHRRDARQIEHGIPVRVSLPEAFAALPGERLDIRFE